MDLPRELPDASDAWDAPDDSGVDECREVSAGRQSWCDEGLRGPAVDGGERWGPVYVTGYVWEVRETAVVGGGGELREVGGDGGEQIVTAVYAGGCLCCVILLWSKVGVGEGFLVVVGTVEELLELRVAAFFENCGGERCVKRDN